MFTRRCIPHKHGREGRLLPKFQWWYPSNAGLLEMRGYFVVETDCCNKNKVVTEVRAVSCFDEDRWTDVADYGNLKITAA